jgi:hypothetical protein
MLAASTIALMMEAPSTSETSVNFYQNTLRNNPEHSHHLHLLLLLLLLILLLFLQLVTAVLFGYCPSST